jgi:formylglycine-generating enzyme required for sulfatase activity
MLRSYNTHRWVADWYDQTYYQHLLRTTARDGARPSMRNHGTGFRCAKNL